MRHRVHSEEESFDDFAVFAIPRLRQVAHAWTRDRHRAEDAVQGTLERVFAAWPRVRTGEAYGYAHHTGAAAHLRGTARLAPP